MAQVSVGSQTKTVRNCTHQSSHCPILHSYCRGLASHFHLQMKNVAELVLISILLVGVYGCSTQSSELRHSGVIPAGTLLKVALIDAIGTERSTPGDHFSGTLAEAVVIGGKTLLEKGTRVRGRIFDLREARGLNGMAELHLVLSEIIHGGKTIAIATQQLQASDPIRGSNIYYAPKTLLNFLLATLVEI